MRACDPRRSSRNIRSRRCPITVGSRWAGSARRASPARSASPCTSPACTSGTSVGSMAPASRSGVRRPTGNRHRQNQPSRPRSGNRRTGRRSIWALLGSDVLCGGQSAAPGRSVVDGLARRTRCRASHRGQPARELAASGASRGTGDARPSALRLPAARRIPRTGSSGAADQHPRQPFMRRSLPTFPLPAGSRVCRFHLAPLYDHRGERVKA